MDPNYRRTTAALSRRRRLLESAIVFRIRATVTGLFILGLSCMLSPGCGGEAVFCAESDHLVCLCSGQPIREGWRSRSDCNAYPCRKRVQKTGECFSFVPAVHTDPNGVPSPCSTPEAVRIGELVGLSLSLPSSRPTDSCP